MHYEADQPAFHQCSLPESWALHSWSCAHTRACSCKASRPGAGPPAAASGRAMMQQQDQHMRRHTPTIIHCLCSCNGISPCAFSATLQLQVLSPAARLRLAAGPCRPREGRRVDATICWLARHGWRRGAQRQRFEFIQGRLLHMEGVHDSGARCWARQSGVRLAISHANSPQRTGQLEPCKPAQMLLQEQPQPLTMPAS